MKRLETIFFIIILFFVINAARSQASSQKNYFDKIVIDAGHGGNDLGAPGRISNEKDITLSLALKIGELVNGQMPGVQVIFTRVDDRFVPLHKRAAIANDSLADLFLSLHCNSNTHHEVFGSETFVMGIHKTEENLEVAKTENAALLLEEDHGEAYDGFNPESDEDYIMLNMFQSSSLEHSIRFSQILQDKLEGTAGLYNRGVKQAGFVVLYLTTMPGVLIETGFISNPAEEEFLLKSANQDKIAQAVLEAVMEYKMYHNKLEGISDVSGDEVQTKEHHPNE